MTSTKTELQKKPLKLIIGQSNVGRVKKVAQKYETREREGGKTHKERENWGETVRCREIIGLSGTRAWREASIARVCVSHERVLFSDKYIVLISVCVGTTVSVCCPPLRHSLCVSMCVCMWPIVRWQSHRASCRYALSHRVHLIHQRTHTHRHTTLGGLCWDREHRGERDERERGRVKVRPLSLLPPNTKLTFFCFLNAHQSKSMLSNVNHSYWWNMESVNRALFNRSL